jgi:hypothetical protein
MYKKSEIVAGFAWASVLLMPWFMILGVVAVTWLSSGAWVFFLVVAILASAMQHGVEVKKP